MNNLSDQQVNARFARISDGIQEDATLTGYGMRHGRTTRFDLEMQGLFIGAALVLIFFGPQLTPAFVLAIGGVGFIGVLGLLFRRFKTIFALTALGLTLVIGIAILAVYWQHLLPYVASFS